MSLDNIRTIGRLTDALMGLYVDHSDKSRLLGQIEKLMDYLEKEGEIIQFFRDYGLDPSAKKEVIGEMSRALAVDELLSNCLYIMVDTHAISSMDLLLSTLRSRLLREMNIKNIYVYSCFPLENNQIRRLEKLWKDRLNKECHFHYAIDKSLRLGIKVQVDMYIEEYSLSSRIRDLKIKLDSLLGH